MILDTTDISTERDKLLIAALERSIFVNFSSTLSGPNNVNYVSKRLCHLLLDGLALIFKRLVQKLVRKDARLCKICEDFLGLYI